MDTIETSIRHSETRPSFLERRAALESGLARAAIVTLRYGLVLTLLYWGAFKFTAVEAQAIEPLVRNSPLMGWTYALGSVQAVSAAVGVTEIAIALLIAVRAWSASAAALGSLLAVGMFVVTLSFLFTTPGMWVSIPDFPLPVPNELGAFVSKDVFLLGAALASAREAVAALRSGEAAR